MAQSFGTQVFRGFVMTATAGASQALLQFVSLIVLARLIAPEAFGLVYPLNATFMIVIAFLTAGIEQALVQRADIDDATERAAVQMLFGGSLVAFVLGNLLLPFLIDGAASPDALAIAHVLTLLLPMQAARAYSHGRLSHQLAFRRLAVLTTLHNVVFVGLAVLFAITLRNPYALAIPMIAQWVVYLPFCRRVPALLFARPPSLDVFLDLLRFGGPMTGATIAQNVTEHVDQVAAGTFPAATAGLYNRASMLANVPGRVTNMMAKQLGLAALSKLRDQPARLAQAYRRGVVLLGLLGLPGMAFMLHHADTLIEVILGAKWLAGSTVFLLIAAVIHARNVRRMPVWVLLATNHPGRYCAWQTVFALLKIGLCLTLGLRSIEWLAGAVAIAQGVDLAVMAVLASRVSRVRVRDFVLAHRGGALLGLGVLVLMQASALTLHGEHWPSWQILAVDTALCGALFVFALGLGAVRWIDDDHRWVCGQIEGTATRILARLLPGPLRKL